MAGRDDAKNQALERLLRENRLLSGLGSFWCLWTTVVAMSALHDDFVAMWGRTTDSRRERAGCQLMRSNVFLGQLFGSLRHTVSA
jgi:uncharacterized BrkB/YihY/UPF0761 family membrane protein